MAKLLHPYQCDVAPCRSLKGLESHWFLLVAVPSFLLTNWDDKLATQIDALHICSEQCAQRALAKWLAGKGGAGIVREITHI